MTAGPYVEARMSQLDREAKARLRRRRARARRPHLAFALFPPQSSQTLLELPPDAGSDYLLQISGSTAQLQEPHLKPGDDCVDAQHLRLLWQRRYISI